MTVYIVIIALILVAAWLSTGKRNSKLLFWTLSALLVLISAIRYQVGTDYPGYESRFYYVQNGISDGGFESGFLWLVNLIIRFGGNAQVMFAIMSILTGLAFGYTIYKNDDPKYRFFALFVYVCSTVYFGTMNAMRQYFAIAILIFGFEFLKKRRYVLYILCIFFASLFHTSAIFMLPFAIFVFINDRKSVSLLGVLNALVFISIIFMFVDLRPYVDSLIDFIPERYTAYIFEDYFSEKYFEARNFSAILKCIFPTALWFFTYYNRKKLFMEHEYIDLYMIGWALYVIINNAFYGINIFIRVYTLFEYFSLYIVPAAIGTLKLKSNRRIASVFVVLYYIALTSYAIFYKNGHSVIPYNTIFDRGLL